MSSRLVLAPDSRRADEAGDRAARRAALALVAVGVLYFVLQNVLVRRPLGLTTDEADYLAKVDPAVPELYWSAVRAWGVPVLAAPVAVFSPGVGVLRLYLSALSSAGLVAAFWPWRRLLHPAVAPLAALLFATTWFSLFFGVALFPNLYVALGAVGVVGLYLRAVGTRSWWRTALAGLATAFVALVRPSDSLLLLAPLIGCALLVPRLRRFDVLGALLVGDLLGWLPWVVEAYQRFGGPLARLRAGNEGGLSGGVGLTLSNLLTYPRLLDGVPTYCCYGAPAAKAGPLTPAMLVWSVALPALAVLGLVLARRRGQLPQLLVVAATAAAFLAFYGLLLTFAAARFLLPICALLSLPVAAGLLALLRAERGPRRVAGGVLAGAVLMGHLALMLSVAARVFPAAREQRRPDLALAAALRPVVRGHPCLVSMDREPVALSYYLRCHPQMLVRTGATPRSVLDARARQWTVVTVLRKRPPPDSYLSSWRRVPLPRVGRGYAAYVAP